MVPLVALALGFVQCIAAVTVGPTGTLTIENKVISPDGFQRSTVLAGGTHPGPLIKANKGDRFHLNVVDRLTDDTMLRATSIHWHGFFQNSTNYADGVVGVSQCPISPGHEFLYEFDTHDQAGTFWYHSHYGTQYCDGLRGPLVVYDPHDPHKDLYDVDDESTIITLTEWYHEVSAQTGIIAMSDATLVNGKGRYFGGPKVDLAVINVQHGKRYRIRLVSASCEPNFIFSIDGHQLTIIEVDGENTQPLTVDSIQIFVAQRYSLILNANQPVDNYWIRALPNFGNTPLNFDGGINSAILRYRGANTHKEPTTNQKTNPVMLEEAKLRPLTNPKAPGRPKRGGADVNINLAVTVDLDAGIFLVNGVSYVSPTVPVLLQILSGAHTAQDLLPAGSVYVLPRNKVVEISIPGGALGGPHPIHLHGHAFSVVKSAGNDTKYNYDNPVRRDVVNIGDVGSNVTIRFNTDNPGPWILHCHIDFHLSVGFAVVFAEDPSDSQRLIDPPDAWDDLCPVFDSLPPSETEVRNATVTA